MNNGYGEAKATKLSRMEFEKSESADSTGESGEPTQWDPVEGSGRSDRAFFWRDRWRGHRAERSSQRDNKRS